MCDELQSLIAGKTPATLSLFLKAAGMKTITPESELKFFKNSRKDSSLKIVELFMDAVEKRDSYKIMQIAYAVEYLKYFKVDGDRYRADILCAKHLLDNEGKKWPIRKLATEIKWPLSDAADGFSRLRRLCRELNFPLAISRQIDRNK